LLEGYSGDWNWIYGGKDPLRAWSGGFASCGQEQPDSQAGRKPAYSRFDQLRLAWPLADRDGSGLGWRFRIPGGLLSHWQVWIAAAIAVQYLSWQLSSYAGKAIPPEPEVEPAEDSPAAQPATRATHNA
jgi:hypothetical protein